MKLHELGLEDDVQAIAAEYSRAFPEDEYTSGARTPRDQARAMSQNISERRTWVQTTYLDSVPKREILTWLGKNPAAVSAAEIEKGLASVLSRFTPDVLETLSLHMGKRAFDVQPYRPYKSEQASKRIAFLHALAAKHGGTFLEKEGRLIRWHYQQPRKPA